MEGQALNPKLGVQGGPHSPIPSLKPKVIEFSSPASLAAGSKRTAMAEAFQVFVGEGLGGRGSLQYCPPGKASLPNCPTPPPV